MNVRILVQMSLYFLALINPASKVFLLSSVKPPYSRSTIARISAKATFTAFLILVSLTTVGQFLLKTVFQVEMYSLEIAGGVVLFIVGLTAVRKGFFYEMDLHGDSSDIAIVPLAAPLIAGPGTMAAAISLASKHGAAIITLSLTAALLVNFFIMLSSSWLGKALDRHHVLGPLIRITGLIVAAVAVQMVLTGISQWQDSRLLTH
jgi:multiple antibiotic resistance protein